MSEQMKMDAERAAFEAFHTAECKRLGMTDDDDLASEFDRDSKGNYIYIAAETGWRAWQARASLPVAGSAVEEVEVVAYRTPSGGLYQDKEIAEVCVRTGHQCATTELMTVAQHERIVATLSAQQSAPEWVSVPDNVREAVGDAIAEALGDAYDCTRVWSAWGVGTMSQNDFHLITDDASRIGELADAAISAFLASHGRGEA